MKKMLFLAIMTMIALTSAFSQIDGFTPIGANSAMDLYSPSLMGRGGFITLQGGSPASALNPAAEGDAQRIIFDAGFLGMSNFGSSGLGFGANIGAVFPTRVGVFGGSLHFIRSPFIDFPIETTMFGNVNAAKELYPGLSVGIGLNLGYNVNAGALVNGDLGFRYNLGRLGHLDNFTFAAAV